MPKPLATFISTTPCSRTFLPPSHRHWNCPLPTHRIPHRYSHCAPRAVLPQPISFPNSASNIVFPLAFALPPASPWTVVSLLLVSASLGLLSTRTGIGAALSAPLVTALLTLFLSNLTLLPITHPSYTFVTSKLVPLAVPLLLFGADLRRVLRETGALLSAFLVGTIGTLLGTVISWRFVPLTSTLGPDAWKIAASLCARHIGGAVNYVATAEATGAAPASVAAGLAADNLVVALYFMLLLVLARGVSQPPRAAVVANGTRKELVGEDAEIETASISTPDMSAALAIAACLVALGTYINSLLPIQLGAIPVVTALVLIVATAFPHLLSRYKDAANGLGILFMQIFFAVTGAGGSIASVIRKAPMLFLFSTVQLGVHLAFVLVVGRLLRMHLSELLLASNANVGGPTTAAGMAAAKDWERLIIPALLVGVFGYSIATFASLGMGHLLLKPR